MKNENLEKLVQAARDKKPTEFKSTLTDEIDGRIEARVAEINADLAQNMFKTKTEPEVVSEHHCNEENEGEGVEHTHDDGTTHTHEGGDKPHTHEEGEHIPEGKLPPALQKAIDAKKKNNSKADDKDKSPPKDDEEEDEDKDPVGEKFDIRDVAKKVLQKHGLPHIITKEDSDKSEPGTQGDDAEYAKKRDAVLKKFGVKSCAALPTEEEKKACFKALDDAHVADHEE